MALARVRGPGQPDQMCDLVAAAIVEEYLRRDPAARTNIRVSGGQGMLFVAGEVSSTADFDVSAVVRRTMSSNGVTAAMEPFIAMEPLAAGWAQPVGSREVLSIAAYATKETPERLPRCMAVARDVARELERRRTTDPEWYWLGADYEVCVEDGRLEPLIIIRAEHVDVKTLHDVRQLIMALASARWPKADIRVNPAGEEILAGMASRMASSGQASSMDVYGSALPNNRSGVGRHLLHPLNLGAWLAQAMANDLVKRDLGQAVLMQAVWLPLEARPASLRIRNERGQDLNKMIDQQLLDLTKAQDAFLSPSLVTTSLRQAFDGGVSLPWSPSAA